MTACPPAAAVCSECGKPERCTVCRTNLNRKKKGNKEHFFFSYRWYPCKYTGNRSPSCYFTARYAFLSEMTFPEFRTIFYFDFVVITALQAAGFASRFRASISRASFIIFTFQHRSALFPVRGISIRWRSSEFGRSGVFLVLAFGWVFCWSAVACLWDVFTPARSDRKFKLPISFYFSITMTYLIRASLIAQSASAFWRFSKQRRAI